MTVTFQVNFQLDVVHTDVRKINGVQCVHFHLFYLNIQFRQSFYRISLLEKKVDSFVVH